MARLGRGHPAGAYVFIPSGRGVVNATKTLAATVTTTPARIRGISRHLPLASVSTTRFDIKQARSTRKATVTANRAMVRRVGKVLVKALSLVALMTKIKARFVTFAASVALVRADVRRVGTAKLSSVSLARFRVLRGQLPRARAVSLVGARVRALGVHRVGTSTVARAIVRQVRSAKLSTVTLNRFAVRSFVRRLTIAATVALTRLSTRTMQRVRTSSATVTLTGSRVRQVGLKRVKQFTLSPVVIRRVGKIRSATVSMTRFRINATSKTLRAPVVLSATASLIKMKRLTLAAVAALNVRTVRRITHTQKAISSLVGKAIRQPGVAKRAQVSATRFRSTQVKVVRLTTSTTNGIRLRVIAPAAKVVQVHASSAHRVFVSVRHAATVATSRTMVRLIGRVRLASVSTVRGLRRLIAHGTRTTVALTARTITATARYRAYLASVYVGRVARRSIGVHRVGQVATSGRKLRAVLRALRAFTPIAGARSVKRGYALAKLATVTAIGTRIAHRTVVKVALASISLTSRRVRRIARTTARAVYLVGKKRVTIRLTNPARLATSVLARGADRVLRLLAPGHSSPGVLTGRKSSASGVTGRATGGGIGANNTANGAAMIGRSVAGGIAGNRVLGSGMTGVTNVVNGAVSMYRVVKSARVSAKGSAKRV